MLGGFLNVEGVDLAERGEDPRVVPVDELGIPTYDELVLVATPTGSPTTPRRSASSSPRSSAAPATPSRDPAGATEALLDAGDGLDPKLTRAEIDATLPLLLPDQRAEPYGYMDPARVGGVRRLLRRPRPDRTRPRPTSCSPTSCCRARSRVPGG